MLKFILTGILLIASSGFLLAQTDTTFNDYLERDKGKGERTDGSEINKIDKPKSEFRERLSFGGNLGLSFGTITLINVNPIIYYNTTERLDLGMSFNYLYFKNNQLQNSFSMYGLGPISRFRVVDNIYALGELDFQNFPVYEPFTNQTTRQWITGVLVGASYFQSFDGRSGAMISALYNLTWDQYRSPYASPFVIRFGFLF